MINRDRLTKLFTELAQINGPSGNERAVADYSKNKLTSLGLAVDEDSVSSSVGGNAGNVFAHLKGALPDAVPIFLNCHMDTIEPTESLRISNNDGTLASDGLTILGADDRAGMAAVIEAVESIVEDHTACGDVQIIFSVSEEVGLRGAKAMDRSRVLGRFGFVLDSQKPAGGITVSAPSHETVSVEIQGKAAHAGMAPEQGISAIVAAGRAIGKMTLGRIDEETTANIGIISGGKARNIIPDAVSIKGEARSRSEEKLAAQVRHMRQVFEEEAAAIGAQVDFQNTREYDGFRWNENDPIIRLACAASELIVMKPVFQDGGGGSDANVFNSVGIPTVVVGAGYDAAHTHSEHIAVDDLVQAARFAEGLIRAAAGWRE